MSCNVKGCIYDGSSKSIPKGLSFYNIPRDVHLRAQWLNVTGIKPVSKFHVLVCSNHFLETDFIDPKSKKKLKPDAIPSRNLSGENQENPTAESEILNEIIFDSVDTTYYDGSNYVDIIEDTVEINSDYGNEMNNIKDKNDDIKQNNDAETKHDDNDIKLKEGSGSETIIENKKLIDKYNTQSNMLRRCYRNRSRKLSRLNNALQKAEKIKEMNSKIEKFLKRTDIPVPVALFKRLSTMDRHSKTLNLYNVYYPDEVKRFAYELYSISSDAYEIMYDVFKDLLPKPSLIPDYAWQLGID